MNDFALWLLPNLLAYLVWFVTSRTILILFVYLNIFGISKMEHRDTRDMLLAPVVGEVILAGMLLAFPILGLFNLVEDIAREARWRALAKKSEIKEKKSNS